MIRKKKNLAAICTHWWTATKIDVHGYEKHLGGWLLYNFTEIGTMMKTEATHVCTRPIVDSILASHTKHLNSWSADSSLRVGNAGPHPTEHP